MIERTDEKFREWFREVSEKLKREGWDVTSVHLHVTKLSEDAVYFVPQGYVVVELDEHGRKIIHPPTQER
jgi:hypothetical protein